MRPQTLEGVLAKSWLAKAYSGTNSLNDTDSQYCFAEVYGESYLTLLHSKIAKGGGHSLHFEYESAYRLSYMYFKVIEY